MTRPHLTPIQGLEVVAHEVLEPRPVDVRSILRPELDEGAYAPDVDRQIEGRARESLRRLARDAAPPPSSDVRGARRPGT